MRRTDWRSPEAAAYRAIYKSARWQHVRKTVLARDGYQCRWPGCGKMLIGSHHQHNAPVVHHRVDHKGDALLFFDAGNLMAVCKACHDRQAQRTTHTGFIAGSDTDGMPLDPEHPWVKARRERT